MNVLIYNITLNVKKAIHEDWLQWYKKNHIPDVMNTLCFTECKLYRVIYNDEIDYSYRMHYFFNHIDNYNRYEVNYADSLNKKHSDRFPQIIVTATLLEEIDL